MSNDKSIVVVPHVTDYGHGLIVNDYKAMAIRDGEYKDFLFCTATGMEPVEVLGATPKKAIEHMRAITRPLEFHKTGHRYEVFI
jgi:hypothetical protein